MRGSRALPLAVLCGSAFLGAIDVQLANIAFPDMLRSFPSSGLPELSWVFNGYAITFTAALLPAGGLADRFGYRRVFLAGLTVFVIGAALCAIAPSAGILIAARVVQGVGGGVITPLTLALILPYYPPERRGTAIGLWSATQSVATASGPSLGGLLVGVWDWRTVFFLHLPVGLVVLAGAWRTLARTPPSTPSRLPDIVGLILLVAAIGLPSLAIVQSDAWGPGSPGTITALVAGVVFGVLFVRRARSHPAPIVDLKILRARSTQRANLAMFLLGLVMFALPLANILFLTRIWGYSETQAGLAVTPGAVAQVLTAPIAGRLAARTGHRRLALCGVVLLSLATACLAVATGGGQAYLTVVFPAVVVTGVGIAVLVTSLSGAAVAEIPPARLATGTALSVTSRACGAVIGVSALVLVLSGHRLGVLGAYHGVWATMLGICAFIALAAAGLHGPEAPATADAGQRESGAEPP
ncbi:DHA2 family efflux MFS transporter permease subunit [Nonomuraea guangzhouensis]|uniref:DHA2 family efflux MFS transporter permease subunit n=1 Tax=Nonomuraea guangzhouensis TaxID=1291555 RepID=A0ABW4GFG3_9ACTN|nr:DHA2 family efflux MFS transporter permease subunit [Nonomuraea guangzhouensis]